MKRIALHMELELPPGTCATANNLDMIQRFIQDNPDSIAWTKCAAAAIHLGYLGFRITRAGASYCYRCGERECICADSDFYRNGVVRDAGCGYVPQTGHCDHHGSPACDECPFDAVFGFPWRQP